MARFSAEEYRAASLEHIKLAEDLHDEARYLPSHYVAGLAVECMLRAYHFRVSREIEGRHNVDRLYEDSGYDRIVPKVLKAQVGSDLTIVKLRWSNSHRYRTTESLKRRLLELRANRGIVGDLLQGSSRTLLNAAIELVQLGDLKWKT